MLRSGKLSAFRFDVSTGLFVIAFITNTIEFSPHLLTITAGHLPFRAWSRNAVRAGVLEQDRRDVVALTQHLGCQFTDFPLRSVAAADIEEMQQLPDVHRQNDHRFAGIRQHVPHLHLHYLTI